MQGQMADPLSELDDELLAQVLRCLPAVEAVRTASLSKRWRDLPSLLPVRPHLLVGTPLSSPKQKPPSCVFLDLDAIDRALSSDTSLLGACEIVPEAVPDVRRVQRWAEALVQRGIRELVLDSRREPGPDASPVVTLCRSLFKLDLRACRLFPQTLCIWFPSVIPVGCLLLTHLRLVEVEVGDYALLGIASACKRLARLELIGCKGLELLRLEEVQSLKDLIIHSATDAVVDGDLRCIEIDAPNLEVLDLSVLPPRYGLKVVAPKLRSVQLCLHGTCRRFFPAAAPGLRRLLQGAADVSCLQLRGGAVDCLSVDRLPDGLNSPYLNLKRLYIDLALKHGRQALCLIVLLQKFSILQKLNLFKITKWEVDEGGEAPPEFKEHKRRLEPASCIRSNLQVVTMSGCTGDLYEMGFAAFVLTNARALKKLTLSLKSDCSSAGESAAHNLAHLVRASPKAKFAVKRSR